MEEDETPNWIGDYRIEISTREPVFEGSLRLLAAVLPGHRGSPETGVWEDPKDERLWIDRDAVTITSIANDIESIQFAKRAVAIVAASLKEEAIFCVTTHPDGTFQKEIIYSKEVADEEMNNALSSPWSADLFSDELIGALASVNYDRSSKKAEQYREDLKKARPSDAEQGITLSKLPSFISELTTKRDLMISERIVDDSEEIIRMISGKFKQG